MKRRRLNIKAMLADPETRRELFVGTIIATQAREGIMTTREQALDAYYKVRLENFNRKQRTKTFTFTTINA